MTSAAISKAGHDAYSACLPLLHHAARLNYTYYTAVELDRQAQKFLNSAMAERFRFSRDEYLQLVQARWAFDASVDYERHCLEQQERHRSDQAQALENPTAVRQEDLGGNHLTVDQQGEFSGPPMAQQWRENSSPDIDIYPPTNQQYQDGQRTPRQRESPVSNEANVRRDPSFLCPTCNGYIFPP